MAGLLIVEDEYIIRNNLVAYYDWGKLGFDWVEQAENGRRALEILAQRTPDVVITDIRMPHVTGMELIRRLEEMEKSVAVIVISAFVDIAYFRTAIRFHVFDYILKPIDPAELLACTARALEFARDCRVRQAALQYAKSVPDFILPPAAPAAHQAAAAGEPVIIGRIKRLIEERYMLADFGVNAIAQELSYTSSYICMIFKRNTGQTVNDYITAVRIQNARMLLSDPSLKLYDVAALVGFSDENYFSKVFKKCTGTTPAAYRKAGGGV